MAPAAARRAKLVQRSNFQGLQGNPDACRPRRGSACNKIARKTGGNARPVSALSVQPTAAMNPRTGGPRVGEAPRPFFSPISSGRNRGARRAGAPRGGGTPARERGTPHPSFAPQMPPSPQKGGRLRADDIRPYRAWQLPASLRLSKGVRIFLAVKMH